MRDSAIAPDRESAIRTLGGHRRYRESEVKALLGDVIPTQRSARD